MKSIVINVDANRRIRVYREGGMDLECRVEGIGWVLDNDAEVSDDVIRGHLDGAAMLLKAVSDRLNPALVA